VIPSVPSCAVTWNVNVSAAGGVHASSYVLLPAVEATTFASVSVTDATVAPSPFVMRRSALVTSDAPNGSATVRRTYAATPASIGATGDPPGNGVP
jgi:hypothetical protein